MFAVCHWTLSIISLITERQLRPWTTSERSCFDVPNMETYQSSVGIVEHRELLLAQTNINRRNHRTVEGRTFIGIQLRRQDGSEKNVFNDRTRWTGRAAEVQIENWNLWARDPCWVGVWCCNRFPLNHHRLLSYWIYGSFGVVQLSAVRNDVESKNFCFRFWILLQKIISSTIIIKILATFVNQFWIFIDDVRLPKLNVQVLKGHTDERLESLNRLRLNSRRRRNIPPIALLKPDGFLEDKPQVRRP